MRAIVNRQRINFLFLNIGHFFDHFFVLVFATIAALTLARDWGMSYAELIPYATPGFIAFGVCAIPAGWIADKWSREGMMVIFFIGIGAASMFTALAQTPLQIGFALFIIGCFAAIYHPVGLAMVVHGRVKTGVPLAVNGIFGNMGVASAALIAGFLIDQAGWRIAFVLPGAISIATGIAYWAFVRNDMIHRKARDAAADATAPQAETIDRAIFVRVFAIIFISTAIGGLIFQSTTFSLPKIFDERLGDIASSATLIGWYTFLVFAVAAFAQLVVGYLVDRHSIRIIFAFVASLQIVFFMVMQQMAGVWALYIAIAFMLVVFGQIPINDVLVGRITRSEWRSRVYAFRYIVTFTVSSTAVPLIAWIHSDWGFSTLFVVLAIAAAIILVCVLLLPKGGVVIQPAAPS